jgi:hypothetical protein
MLIKFTGVCIDMSRQGFKEFDHIHASSFRPELGHLFNDFWIVKYYGIFRMRMFVALAQRMADKLYSESSPYCVQRKNPLLSEKLTAIISLLDINQIGPYRESPSSYRDSNGK